MTEEKTDLFKSLNPGNVYRIMVCDPAGTAVSGVRLQFCSDVFCQMNITDEQGIAMFDSPEGFYTVHVFSMPDGYLEDNTEYPVPAQYGDVVITLQKA